MKIAIYLLLILSLLGCLCATFALMNLCARVEMLELEVSQLQRP